ncbi:Glycosyltransferase involved in cell wall bisynthesis [Desulfacinum hydrothermale DSM 13146]|uniref:Glycosyltransferase involved in cell wall bisynthesis n=1 Tax=Desulfacinum hydrothermale DSM 13146 TaxID=1121390 RepID=A0A1W1XET5_9BACT|nr:glycosyltransferase [Desulfacinum hydrothermale]SMC22439.1 Glycosyltransferase involved in cell wall bisynthesis [Desulfacinum hydrothermale DSM 13146]
MRDASGSLSVCMIVKNEASNICQALESFRDFADEIIVVDTGSTDDTAALAASFTPHVYHYPWHDDFAAARNFSFRQARCDYFLWMDADDRVDALNAAKINALKKQFDGRRAFAFELQDIRNGELYRSLMQIRCIPNRQDVRFKGRVHESIDWDGLEKELRPVDVDIVITHHGYNDPLLLEKKVRRNIRLFLKELEEGRDDATLHYYLALSYRHAGNHPAAIRHMQKAVYHLEKRMFHSEKDADDLLRNQWLDAQLFLVQEWLECGKNGDARRLLAKITCESALDPLTLFRIGTSYQSLEAHADALRFLTRVDPEKQKPTALPTPRIGPAQVAARIALSLFCLDREEEALRSITLLDGTGARKEAWENLGVWAAEAGRYGLGKTAFEKALELGDLTALGWEQWGVVWERMGDMPRAETCWRKALELDQAAEGAAIHLANLLWRSNRSDESFEMFRRLVHQGCCQVPVLLAYGIMACDRHDSSALGKIRENLAVFLGLEKPNGAQARLVFHGLAHHLEEQEKDGLARLARRLARWEESVNGQTNLA